MGFLSRRAAAPAARIEPYLAAEARGATTPRYGDGWQATTLGTGGYGGAVASHLSENLSAVTGAIELISSGVASLPASLQIEAPGGRIAAPDTAPAWRILERPSAFASWPGLVMNLVGDLALHGNGLALIRRDLRGAPAELIHVPWTWVSPVILRGAGGTRLAFDVINSTPEAELLSLPGRILDSDALHVKARGGVVGRSVLSRAANVIAEGVELQTAATALWRNGLRSSAVISTTQTLDDGQHERLRSRLKDYTGSGNTARVLVLSNGLTVEKLALSSADAEMLATRRLSTDEIARLYVIPAAMLQAGQHASAPAELQAQFAQQCLTPVVNLIEAEFSAALLPAGMFLQLDLGGLMRGSFSALVGSLSVALQAGGITANDFRRGLGLPALPGGDDLRMPSVPSYPADAKGVPSLAPKPGQTGALLTSPGTHGNDGAG